jgi:hypothetical protein
MTQFTYEPFVAEFTGQLTSFPSKVTNMRYTFHKPFPRIEKGRAYMMEMDKANNRIKMIPVVG